MPRGYEDKMFWTPIDDKNRQGAAFKQVVDEVKLDSISVDQPADECQVVEISKYDLIKEMVCVGATVRLREWNEFDYRKYSLSESNVDSERVHKIRQIKYSEKFDTTWFSIDINHYAYPVECIAEIVTLPDPRKYDQTSGASELQDPGKEPEQQPITPDLAVGMRVLLKTWKEMLAEGISTASLGADDYGKAVIVSVVMTDGFKITDGWGYEFEAIKKILPTEPQQITADDLKPGMRVLLKSFDEMQADGVGVRGLPSNAYGITVHVDKVDSRDFQGDGDWYEFEAIKQILPDHSITDNGDLIPMPTVMTLTVGVPVYILPGMVVELQNGEVFEIRDTSKSGRIFDANGYVALVSDIAKIISTLEKSPLIWRGGKE